MVLGCLAHFISKRLIDAWYGIRSLGDSGDGVEDD